MELNNIRQKVTAAMTNARMWADRMEWTVNKFEKAGLRKIELIRGNENIDQILEDQSYVILSKLGNEYLIGKLK